MTITAGPRISGSARGLTGAAHGRVGQNIICPAWCDIEDHEDYDGNKMHHTLSWSVPLSAYHYEVMGERHPDWINVSRIQARDSNPRLLLELPSEHVSDDPDRLVAEHLPQVIMTIPEAMELAATLLRLVAQGKPLRQGGSGEANSEPGTGLPPAETGMPVTEIAGWLREMGLTMPEMHQMAEREPLFGQMASLTPCTPSPQG